MIASLKAKWDARCIAEYVVHRVDRLAAAAWSGFGQRVALSVSLSRLGITRKPTERFALIPGGQEHMLAQEDGKKRWGQVVMGSISGWPVVVLRVSLVRQKAGMVWNGRERRGRRCSRSGGAG